MLCLAMSAATAPWLKTTLFAGTDKNSWRDTARRQRGMA
ncbi:unnamed protein product [Gulo gulo]|uniref:Uncharacterized protein n=1 Tax=Gulo gulo TaxID=48420 RepID=A0A9X9MBG8_GULGU|nr:unnamed protein product [Gulo gulo]